LVFCSNMYRYKENDSKIANKYISF
jgi:hypothetical protein